MKLIFFDEAKNDDNYPHYHIGGVCIDESDLCIVESRINEVVTVEQAFGNSKLVRENEIHAADIFHRKRHFKEWSDFNLRVSILEGMVQVLSMNEVHLIDVQINAANLWINQVPDEVAFMFFCERANDLCKYKAGVNGTNLGMLIGDRESDRIESPWVLRRQFI